MTVRLKINGREHAAPEGQPLIDACHDAGVEIPRFCYHPGLSVVGSCRMCLVEIEGQDRLVPACQTPVRDGLNVLADSERVRANQRAVMEYLLLNHPLDCPVCDQAGECYLQDYSFIFGRPISRFVEAKINQPKKDLGRHILLYMDRCVLCSRCVRFTREISGDGELGVVSRGSNCEIDIFPGRPLDNKLSGNVADLCPVGALLDKDFLHSQRAWFLGAGPSVCARCSAGCNINVFHNDRRIWRLKPRANTQVNGWWMCDEGRYGWRYAMSEGRLAIPARVRRGGRWEELNYRDAADVVRFRLAAAGRQGGPGSLAAVLSPMWTCEEQALLARFIRRLDGEAVLAAGPSPLIGQDETFKSGFTIRAEKCPNRRGAEGVLAKMGGPRMEFDELLAAVAAGKIKGLYLGGGYPNDLGWPGRPARAGTGGVEGRAPSRPSVEPATTERGPPMAATTEHGPPDAVLADREHQHRRQADPPDGPPTEWLTEAQAKALATPGLTLIAHDLFEHAACQSAAVVLAGASWAEKSGMFVSVHGIEQRLAAVPVGPAGVLAEGELLGMFNGA